MDAEEPAMPTLAPFNPLVNHLFDTNTHDQRPKQRAATGTDAATLAIITLAIALVVLLLAASVTGMLVIVLIFSAV